MVVSQEFAWIMRFVLRRVRDPPFCPHLIGCQKGSHTQILGAWILPKIQIWGPRVHERNNVNCISLNRNPSSTLEVELLCLQWQCWLRPMREPFSNWSLPCDCRCRDIWYCWHFSFVKSYFCLQTWACIHSAWWGPGPQTVPSGDCGGPENLPPHKRGEDTKSPVADSQLCEKTGVPVLTSTHQSLMAFERVGICWACFWSPAGTGG